MCHYRFWGEPYHFTVFCAHLWQTTPAILKWSSTILTMSHMRHRQMMVYDGIWWYIKVYDGIWVWPSDHYNASINPQTGVQSCIIHLLTMAHIAFAFLHQIGLRENWNRTPLYLMGRIMVSCIISPWSNPMNMYY